MDVFIIIMTILFFLFVVGIYQKLNIIASAFRKALGESLNDEFPNLKLKKGGKDERGRGKKSS